MMLSFSCLRASVMVAVCGASFVQIAEAALPLNPLTVPKFTQQLTIPPAYAPTVFTNPTTGAVSHNYAVDVTQFQEQILPPGFPMTTVWGYGGNVIDPVTKTAAYYRAAPGATFEAVRGTPVNVTWKNNLVDAGGAPLPHLFLIDPTLHWANPNAMPMPTAPFSATGYAAAQSPVPIVTHLHGGEVASGSDGNPEAWFTPGNALIGPKFTSATYNYGNTQPAATLWYHDHTLGITRQNVYAGLAGFYLLRDPADANARSLPSGRFDVPLVIQDRAFLDDGSLDFPSAGVNPDDHPYWGPETFGDVIVVNGKSWPNMNVDRRAYRFRVLNGSNARFYNLALSNIAKFTQVSTDGGYLPKPAVLRNLVIAPGERADIVIDFSKMPAGTKILMTNVAAAPFPAGIAADPATVGQIMQFTVNRTRAANAFEAPKSLNKLPFLKANAPTRVLTLNEIMGINGPLSSALDGQMYQAPASELPRVGSTEIWEIVNTTADTHPIHLHLIQFQLMSRQAFDPIGYSAAWDALNGQGMLPLMQPTVAVQTAPYLLGRPRPAPVNERGWKDTIQMNPGEVTRIIVRYAPTDAPLAFAVPGVNLFKFDPTFGPGYVWHCHILDHEDNDMMRPLSVMP